jgi:hypothetical protein
MLEVLWGASGQLLLVGAFQLFLLFLAILPLRQTRRRPAVIAEVVAHGLAWMSVPLAGLLWLPRFKKIYSDFGTELGMATEFAIAVSDFFSQPRMFFFAPQIVGVLIIVDGLVFDMLWRREASRTQRNSWSLGITALSLTLVALITIPPVLSLARLLNDLS